MYFKAISCNTVCYDVGVRTPNQTRRRTYSKTFISSVFSVVLSGAQTPSTEYKSEYEYEKSFITLGPVLVTYVSRDLGSNSELPHTRRTLLIKEKYLSILIRCRVWAIVANYTCTSKCLKTTRDKHVLVTISVLPYMKYDVTYM